MRGKRSKQYRKLMQQYGLTFGFREPYQVLIDAQMLQDTSRFKMDLVTGLERTLHGQIKPSKVHRVLESPLKLNTISIAVFLSCKLTLYLVITQCTMRHLYLLPTSTPTSSTPSTSIMTMSNKNALIDLARTFERRRCDHHTLDEPLSTLECFTSVVDPKGSGTNKNRYIVASQEEEVRRWARGVKGVPSVYVKRSVMVMEPMSEGSLGVREGAERGKLRGGIRKVGEQGEKKRKREDEGEESVKDDKEANKKRTRGVKGPNPLSVKKAKKEFVAEKAGAANGHDVGDTKVLHDISAEQLITVGPDIPTSYKKKRKRKHKSETLALRDDAIVDMNHNEDASISA
ncbi:hypothetical protein MMC18_002177 [Xylographa bjoerkii]|nr:hypothetical protein [Xylographa bjoerkii]